MNQAKSVEEKLYEKFKVIWSVSTDCLNRPYHFKVFKGFLSQILLGPFLNTMLHLKIQKETTAKSYFKKILQKVGSPLRASQIFKTFLIKQFVAWHRISLNHCYFVELFFWPLNLRSICVTLYFKPITGQFSFFYSSWKIQTTSVFQMFSGGIERRRWPDMS